MEYRTEFWSDLMDLGAQVAEFNWDSEYFSSAAAGPMVVLKLGSRFLVIQERPEHDWDEYPRALLPDASAVKTFVESIIQRDFVNVEGVDIRILGFAILTDLPDVEAQLSSLADEYWHASVADVPNYRACGA